MNNNNNKLRWFSYQHLPEHIQPTSKIFAELASIMELMCPTNSDQRTIAFQKLIEVKDAYVRACLLHVEAIKEQNNE